MSEHRRYDFDPRCIKCGEPWPCEVQRLRDEVARLMAPIPMVLHCPACGHQHVDKAEPSTGWTNPPHKSHLCHRCGEVWRPAAVATVGVERLPRGGPNDTWYPDSKTAEGVIAELQAFCRDHAKVCEDRDALRVERDAAQTELAHLRAYVVELETLRVFRFNEMTGCISGGDRHPDRCVCQGSDPTPHKHYGEPPHSCARCGHKSCAAYRPAVARATGAK